MSKRESFYELEKFPYVERAILAESISFSSIKNLTGKFYLPVMMAGMKNPDKALDTKTNLKYTESNYMNLIIPAYMLFGFLKSTKSVSQPRQTSGIITKEQMTVNTMNIFSGVIPEGTTFLVSFIGGELAIDKTYIVGVLPNIE